MLEQILVGVLVAGAALWLIVRLVRSGKGGCSCDSASTCPHAGSGGCGADPSDHPEDRG